MIEVNRKYQSGSGAVIFITSRRLEHDLLVNGEYKYSFWVYRGVMVDHIKVSKDMMQNPCGQYEYLEDGTLYESERGYRFQVVRPVNTLRELPPESEWPRNKKK